MRIAVIGAGLPGLLVARSLQQDHDVVVFEKSRGVGILSGSMARLGAKVTGMRDCARLVVDHGAIIVAIINRSRSTTCCSALARSAEGRFAC